MKTLLSGSHQHTYDAIFQHPIARNLDWRDVRSLLVAIADETREQDRTLKVTRNGQTLVVHAPMRKTFSDVRELMNIRDFLKQSEARVPAVAAPGTHLLVVIDHRQARVYQAEMHGEVPQSITPYNPGGFGRHLHYVQDDSNGQRKPERKSFYEAIAQALRTAERILLFGSGTGASSAMEQLLVELKREHPQVACRIVGHLVVDEQHLTEDQLLAKAREVYAGIAAAEAARSPVLPEGAAHAEQ